VFTGKALLSGGSYENTRMGLFLNNIKADMSSDNSGLILNSLSADDGLKGKAKGSGRLRFDALREFPYELNMTLKNMQLTGNERLRAVVSGNTVISGSKNGHEITGRIIVENADFQIPEKLPVDITELDIIEINAKTVQVKDESNERSERDEVRYKLAVSSPGRVYISGRGLDSEWKGELKLEGRSVAPIVTGRLSLVRGKYSFLSKSFMLSEGYVTFPGNSPPDPILNVTGKAENSSIKAIISLKGNLKNPVISLNSEPALPQDEILSRILFGRAVSQITPLQALQLAAAINEMIGGKKGFDPLKYTRNLIGVDRLEVRESQIDPGATTISAGKYLKDNIYIEVEKGISTESGKTSVTWELTPSITVETEVGENAEKGMGINWKHDY
jgi:translocation and assembly module TamB